MSTSQNLVMPYAEIVFLYFWIGVCFQSCINILSYVI